MRLIRITTNSPSYLNLFYKKRPKLEMDSYSLQYKEIMNDCYGWADYWTHALVKLGYDVWEPIGNAEPMQKAWASENGVIYDENNWLYDITTSQIKKFNPDILFTNDVKTYNSNYIKYIRTISPKLRLVVGWCASPFANDRMFEAYDLLLSSIPSYVDYFNSKGFRCKYMCHAFEPRVLTKINLNNEKYFPVSFIGSIVKKENFHLNREIFLKQIIRRINLEIWSDLRKNTLYDFFLMLIKKNFYYFVQILKYCSSLYALLEKIPKVRSYGKLKVSPHFENSVANSIVSIVKKPLFGLSMFQALYNSKIVLNIHGDNSAKFASNMRIYEATGVGSCLVTENQNNLKELFKPDSEVVTYSSIEEAVEKINYLLSNESEILKMGLKGQKRTLENHTFDVRAETLDKIIRRNI